MSGGRQAKCPHGLAHTPERQVCWRCIEKAEKVVPRHDGKPVTGSVKSFDEQLKSIYGPWITARDDDGC